MKVKFKTEVSNPKYRYGDLGIPTRIPYEGTGEVIEFLDSQNYIRCIVKTNDKKLYSFNLDELEVI